MVLTGPKAFIRRPLWVGDQFSAGTLLVNATILNALGSTNCATGTQDIGTHLERDELGVRTRILLVDLRPCR